MNTPPQIPPPIPFRSKITYQLTRWDLVLNFVTVLFRNRVTQILFPVFLLLNTAMVSRTILGAVVFAVVFTGVTLGVLFIIGLPIAFLLKQRGVVGEHVLEITDQGLIERTAFNESLHKWASICRITAMFGYLYIYVSEMNSYPVPKRYFSQVELAQFEAELRAHATQHKP